jgi:hypothetical protein
MYKVIAIFFGLFLYGCLFPMNQEQVDSAKYDDPYTVVCLLSHEREKPFFPIIPKELNYAVAGYLCRDVLNKKYGFTISQASAIEYLGMDYKNRRTLIQVFKELKKCDAGYVDLELDIEKTRYVKNLPRPLQVSLYNSLSESKRIHDFIQHSYKRSHYCIVSDKPADLKYYQTSILGALAVSGVASIIGIVLGVLLGVPSSSGDASVKDIVVSYSLSCEVVTFSLAVYHGRWMRKMLGLDIIHTYIPNSYESDNDFVEN